MLLKIAIPAPLHRLFDYLPPEKISATQLHPGVRIQVPFGKRKIIGFLVAITTKSDLPKSKLKPAIAILDNEPILPKQLLELIKWASDYYHHPLGEVFATALPNLLLKNAPEKRRTRKAEHLRDAPTATIFGGHASLCLPYNLNTAQQYAIDTITNSLDQFQTFLLNGVTGSGKTEVYLQVIAKILQENKQALVLVPEIGLTPQTIARFEQRFNVTITSFHSGLTDRERLNNWQQAKSGEAKIIIGTRSAIFTPLLNPGIIIIDEEHDLSFKQQEGFRYCARDLAIVRGRMENIPVLLGTATPSLETFHNAQQNRYQLLGLPERVGNAVQPKFNIIDLRNQKLNSGLSKTLLATMQQHLQNNGQVLLFLNRRGFAPILICQSCGWIANCKRCDAKMTMHSTPVYLQCHHCNSTRKVDTQCPECQSKPLFPLGLGTQRLEQTLQQHFSDVGIVRIDRDSTRRKGKLNEMLQSIHAGEHKILIGTQMLAKGHHFPDVTLVAILDTDSNLFSADFRASERIAQLLIQVAGRAGRAEKLGEVIIQTYHPEHPLLQNLIQKGYETFAKFSLQERAVANLPPHHHLALIRSEAINKEYPIQFLTTVKNLAKQIANTDIQILGPIPSIMPRRAGRTRAQLLLQSPQRNQLQNLLRKLIPKIAELPNTKRVRWSLDVDPRDMS